MSPLRRPPRRLVFCVVVACAAAACAKEVEPTALLPSVASTGIAFTGDPAGPANRLAERIQNPYANDPVAARMGAELFRQMNCVDCHGYSAEGGMGPNLVDREWLFGNTPADRFNSIHGGRARGMPAYGELLPPESVWQIVAHIEELARQSGEQGRAGGEPASATRRAAEPQGGRH